MPAWDQLGMQAASQTIGGVLGLALGGINDRRQVRQQQRLNQLQIAGNKELTDYNTQKQMEMWRNTNYPAQMAMLKQAGLNPALIYDNGGGGASTNITSANVTGGNAPTGGREVQDMMGMALQRQMIAAQIELTKAQTQKTAAETGAVAPTIEKTKMETASLAQGITNQKAAAELMELDAQIKSITNKIAATSMNDQIAAIKYQMQESYQKIQNLKTQNALTATEAKWKEQQIKAELALIGIESYLKSEEAKGIQQSVRESLDRMKTNFQNRLFQADKQSIENINQELEIMAPDDLPDGVKTLLQTLGIATILKNKQH